MPFLSEDEILEFKNKIQELEEKRDEEAIEFNNKIDELEDKHTKLNELNDNNINLLKRKKSQLKISVIICVILFLGLLGSIAVLLFNTNSAPVENVNTETNLNIVEEEKTETALKDTFEDTTPVEVVEEEIIEEEEYSYPEENFPQDDVDLYGVQIGAYANYNVDYTITIKRIPKGGLNCYIVGGFYEEEEAENLKTFLSGIGLKKTTIVKFKN